MSNVQRRQHFSEYKKLLTEFGDGFDIFVDSLTERELFDLMYDLEWQGRPSQQLPPGNWLTWLIKSGRGFGKTWVGAKVVGHWAKTNPQIALIGADIGEVRDVMIDGPSGIIKFSRPDFKPTFNKVLCQLEYPNGARVWGYSGDKPESLRGPNNYKAWIDELFKFRYQQDLWDELQMTMREGEHPQVLITSTPRPTALCKKLVNDPSTVVTTGSTYENYNLSKAFIEKTIKPYEGTRRGRQELYGEILDDNPGALWQAPDIEKGRVSQKFKDQEIEKFWFKEMDRIVVAVDPATTSNEDSDDTGIIVGGRKGKDGYVFDDLTLKDIPSKWGEAVVKGYEKWGADRVVGEVNQGGDMVESIIRNIQPSISYKKVHATRGKAVRAEPIAALYEQGRIHHVGQFNELEDEMLNFNPALGRNQKSPNRMDALVWLFTELFGEITATPRIIQL